MSVTAVLCILQLFEAVFGTCGVNFLGHAEDASHKQKEHYGDMTGLGFSRNIDSEKEKVTDQVRNCLNVTYQLRWHRGNFFWGLF